jgi:hypothetical protein
MEHIEPIFENIDKDLPQAVKLHLAIEANVRLSIASILSYRAASLTWWEPFTICIPESPFSRPILV